MRFFIVDDDDGIRAMLAEIIEDENLGSIVGEANNGQGITAELLNLKQVDILLIDLLMPEKDGIETVRDLGTIFNGKIIFISQVETKELIGEAYSLGIEYYITKPLNRLEIKSILQKVKERLLLDKSIQDIQKSISVLSNINETQNPKKIEEDIVTKIKTGVNFILSELGIICDGGSKDIVDIINYLYIVEKKDGVNFTFPSLKDIFTSIAKKQYGDNLSTSELQREIKASEQRVRRAIHQAISHVASLGLTDYTNPKFENYASKYFDYAQVRMAMLELEEKPDAISHSRINVKKFIKALYIEIKQMIEN